MDLLLRDGQEAYGSSTDPFDKVIVPLDIVTVVKQANDFKLLVCGTRIPASKQ
jgi:hypothetical protein